MHGLEFNLQKVKFMVLNLPKKDLYVVYITYKVKVVKAIT